MLRKVISDDDKEEFFIWVFSRPHDCLLPHTDSLSCGPRACEEHKLQLCQHNVGLLHAPEDNALEVSLASLVLGLAQGGITCGAIDEPRKSSKVIDKRVIIDFRDKNVVIARFRDQNEVFI